jgi:nicotinate-nucleotide adenylyltransferase
MKIGLFFGSFNPIHTGHLIIAQQVLNFTDCAQVWFIVSPQNPLKKQGTLLNEYQRLHLVRLAVEDNEKLLVSPIEFNLPKPSYTIDTLAVLKEKYPDKDFAIVMGSDSYRNIDNWKNADILKKNNSFIIYNRHSNSIEDEPENCFLLNAPLLDISATTIRQLIKQKKSIRYLVPEAVREEIEKSGYYKT